MNYNPTNMYDIEPHIAEIYDLLETYHDDVDLLFSLIAPLLDVRMRTPSSREISDFHILEPFCGTGRILIPFAEQGYTLVGLDQAAGMLDRARKKLARLTRQVQTLVTLRQVDVITAEWPSGFDLIVLGGNCLYELATPEEQELVIRSAAAALNPGGYIYVDNDHMEGGLDPAWQQPGVGPAFPSGICADGTRVESTTETIWFDIPARLVKFRRTTQVALQDGKELESTYIQQKHPVSAVEVRTWLEKYGFIIELMFGDRKGSPYTPASKRAIFWAHL